MLRAVVRGSDVAKRDLLCKGQKKEASWFQFCQQTVDGPGQCILPWIFSSLLYSVLPASPLALDSPCSTRELGSILSPWSWAFPPCPLPWALFAEPLALLSFLTRTELPRPPGTASSPSADAPVSISAGFPMCSMMMSG